MTLLGLIFTLLSCNTTGFGAVSITPIYGWVDGCTPLTIRGHGFADDATATVGGNDLTDITYPDAKEDPLTVGFALYGITPPGEVGYQPVVVASGNQTSEVGNPFYYVECLGPVILDDAQPADGVTAGSTIEIRGCNLDAATYQVKVGDAEPVPFTQTCSTAVATFTAPDLPEVDGGYPVVIVDANGNQIYPDATCDTADSTTYCDTAPVIRYGSAQ